MQFRSLRTKLIAVLLLLLSILAAATAIATLSTMKRDGETQAKQFLSVAGKVLREALDNRAAQLSSSVQILATDFGFRRAVATAEQETIASVLANHGSRIDASVMLLLSPEGELLASSDTSISASDVAPLFSQTQINNSATVTNILQLAGQPYQMVLAPVKAPALIAWVGMGFPLDQPLAEQIVRITGLELSFVARQAGSFQLFISTLDAKHRLELPSLLGSLIAEPGMPLANPDQDYVSLAVPLDPQNQLWAIQHLSNSRWLDNYLAFRQQLFLIFGAALSLTLVVGVFFARSITQPLKALSYFARRVGQGFDDKIPLLGKDEVGVLSRTLSAMQQDIRQREQQLRYNTEHDSLTGLFNRTAMERLLPTLLEQHDGTLLLVNIERFKHINEVLGFSNGDILLQQVASRLTTSALKPINLARLGADEYLLVFDRPLNAGQVTAMFDSVSDAYQLDNSRINLKLRIGIYPFVKQQSNVNDALRRVDIAMENARHSPRRIAEYLPGQDESHQRELTLIRDLPIALTSGQFFAVYQPKVDINTRTCYQAEALIRWQHPTLGFVPPDEFIRLAEHSGHISQITDWMLQHVIAQLALWQQQGFTMTVAVNLSVHDLLDPQLANTIIAYLRQHQLPTSAITLEVTESAVMQDTATIIEQLQRLRDLGIQLAIDDFGTGQSSLAYLKQLPVHEVKIDRAFIKDIEHNTQDALIVKATTQLAHSLGFIVTAEGLENPAGLVKLLQCHCDKVQGYFFSRPLEAQQFSTWVTQFSKQKQQWFSEDKLP
jgi:c-di-GMP phosphodiesterase